MLLLNRTVSICTSPCFVSRYVRRHETRSKVRQKSGKNEIRDLTMDLVIVMQMCDG